MQSENPAPSTESTSTPELDPPSRSNELLKLSTRPSPEPSATNEPLSNVSRTSLDPPSEPIASSRNAMEMNPSTPPSEPSTSTAIKYTRTGRISKAAKGQRVHHCEECGKTYTRAEHLRRHQQNHKPGAYPCDVPGCGRSFHREDLLMRHKARHNEPSDTPSRPASVVSGPPASEAERIGLGVVHGPTFVPVSTSPSAGVTHLPSSTQQDPPSTSVHRTPKRIIPPNELGPGNMAISVVMPPGQLFTNPFLPNPSISPTLCPELDYESSDDPLGPPYRPPPYARSRCHSDSPYLFSQPPSLSRSPPSGSTTIIVPHIFNPDAQYSSDGSAFMHGYGHYHRQSIPHLQHELPPNPSPEQRDIIEQETFRLPSGFLESDDICDPASSPDNGQCLQAYWRCVHELFPVVHFPTYNHKDVSPLLRTAILALGGQAVGEKSSLQHARVLHEKCLKVLRRRTLQDNHSYRTCDLQAIVLVEVYALFKSRRPPLQFSRWFEDACSILCNDSEATILGLSDTTGETDDLTDPFSHFYHHRLDMLCKQRLLLACYLLEQQHNLLFGRSTTCLGDIGSSLPFPSIQQRWDVPHYHSNCADELACDRLAEAVAISTLRLPERDGKACDIFQTLLIQARLGESVGNFHEYVESSGLENPLSFATKLSGRARLTHDIFVLCKMTPIRSLLAVAGESWIMAEKLSSQDEFMAAQHEIREWAAQDISNAAGSHSMVVTKPAIQYALEHALSILKVHREFPRSGLHFQEWAVYLAAVVIWVRGYVRRNPGFHPRLSVANTNEPTRMETELDQTVKRFISAGSTALSSWDETRDVLRWAECKIKPFDVSHNSGLVSEALDVLGKLIMRGNEDGWC